MVTHWLLPPVVAALIVFGTQAQAGSTQDGYRWLSENDETTREGIIWNDAIGDGKDRYKSGGLTQGWVIPDRRITRAPWFDGHASAFEFQFRGLIVTPENTEFPAADDRPFGEYAAIGGYLRTIERPQHVSALRSLSTENRLGLELGLLGNPVPFFEIQDFVHTNSVDNNASNTLDGSFLANIEGRRTWRLHQQLNDTDLEIAPFVQVSAGMRENSARVGGDVIYGSSLEGRLWNHDLATGALIPGGSMPREGGNILIWLGADVGYVASDALLDGGFLSDGPSAAREEITGRLRAGVMFELDEVALAYSMTLLTEEFERQRHSQVVGAVSLKLRF